MAVAEYDLKGKTAFVTGAGRGMRARVDLADKGAVQAALGDVKNPFA